MLDTAATPHIVFDQITKSYGAAQVVPPLDLTIEDGEFVVFVGPYFWPLEATFIDIRARNQGPSLAHPFGTDQLGRDMLARMMAGGQVSMSVGITAMLLALSFGLFPSAALAASFGVTA